MVKGGVATVMAYIELDHAGYQMLVGEQLQLPNAARWVDFHDNFLRVQAKPEREKRRRGDLLFNVVLMAGYLGDLHPLTKGL